jgi:formate dehydrogenase accessory protein FdhD
VVLLKRSLPGGHNWREQLASGFDASLIRYPVAARTTPPPRDGFVLDARSVLALSAELFERFEATTGADRRAHAGATDGATVITTTHDISRHNTLDKLIGWSILTSYDLSTFVVAMRGRVCASTVFRAVRAGVRLLVSDDIPTAQAVKLAQGAGMTIIGDVESSRRTIFSHPWRIDRGAM